MKRKKPGISDDYRRIIETIKACMEEQNMSVAELARAIGSYRQKVHYWLTFRNQARIDDLNAMLRVFGKEVKW